ncbi:hypothetical protein L2750_09505 [Shewanella submarina]|uniref:DUF3828 domain-containing protein n=1 Tax=Shewanella submarina TaxID=2016376 RepID=A0ABV7G9R5_9GAMM|nr:hypothetical protein [Shewanella submarina]MCL1037390.1 hypothetical protein [Shewanella submarina]
MQAALSTAWKMVTGKFASTDTSKILRIDKKPTALVGLVLTCMAPLTSVAQQDFAFENEQDKVLFQRCIKMVETYRSEDFDAYIAEFPDPWLELYGESTLRKVLAKSHSNYLALYQDGDVTVTLEAIHKESPHPREAEFLGATDARVLDINFSAPRKGKSTICKFLLINNQWYMRELR